MFKFIRNWIDNYILKRSIENKFNLTEAQIGFLKDKTNANMLRSIYQAEISAIVVTSLSSPTPESFQKRNEWVNCLTYLISQTQSKKEPDVKINQITRERMSAEEWEKRYGK